MTEPPLPPVSERGGEGRARLAGALRDAREAAGLSGKEAGRRSGVSQSQISRIENGERLPTVDDVEALATAYKVREDQHRQLVALAETLREEQSSRVVLTRGIAASRRRFRELEQAAAVVRGYQSQLVIGLLQTPAYQRAVFSDPVLDVLDAHEVTAAATDQSARRAVLDDESKRFILVMTEGALRWPIGSAELMVEQLDHLAAVATARPQVRVGIIPATTFVRFFPAGSFWLYDATAALVGTEIGNLVPTGRADVAAYLDRFAAIEQAAAFGEQALPHFARLAAEYRALQ